MVAVWERVACWARRRPAFPPSSAEVMAVSPIVRVAVGGGACCVVADTDELCDELFPAASYAETVYEYEVEGESPVSEYEFDADVLICVPLLYIRYPVTPTLSVDAVHERLI